MDVSVLRAFPCDPPWSSPWSASDCTSTSSRSSAAAEPGGPGETPRPGPAGDDSAAVPMVIAGLRERGCHVALDNWGPATRRCPTCGPSPSTCSRSTARSSRTSQTSVVTGRSPPRSPGWRRSSASPCWPGRQGRRADAPGRILRQGFGWSVTPPRQASKVFSARTGTGQLTTKMAPSVSGTPGNSSSSPASRASWISASVVSSRGSTPSAQA